MKILTAEEMAALDRHAIRDLKIPSLTLMENAGYAVAKEAASICKGNNIVIVCGKGNNGGDGFVAARHLALEFNKEVKVILIGWKNEVKRDPKINIEKLLGQGMDACTEAPNYQVFIKAKSQLESADLIIDAIFGIGLNKKVAPPYLEIITYINSLNKNVLAVDVPSGLNATTGEVMGVAIRANETITFAAAKTGFYKADGPNHCGTIKVVDIGIPV
jgi:NAD(P)H-hydrate epimerase